MTSTDGSAASEHRRIAERVEAQLSLGDLELGDEYFYGSITLCVIDAVFSIGVRYESVQAVVRRYAEYFRIERFRTDRSTLPPPGDQDSVSRLLSRFDELGLDRMADDVFANRQRTSTRNGITKAEAVQRFAKALQAQGIEWLQDVVDRMPTPALERGIADVPGQRSGISLRYFWMLAGSDDLIKPDRMILRFLDHALSRSVQVAEAQDLLRGAVVILRERHARLTPRALDYAIWSHQRQADPIA